MWCVPPLPRPPRRTPRSCCNRHCGSTGLPRPPGRTTPLAQLHSTRLTLLGMRLDLAIRPALESVCTATASADAAAAAGRDDAELRRVAAPIIDALLRDESINLSLVPDGLVSRRRVSHRRPRRGPTPSPHLPSGALGSKIQPRPPPLRLRCPPSTGARDLPRGHPAAAQRCGHRPRPVPRRHLRPQSGLQIRGVARRNQYAHDRTQPHDWTRRRWDTTGHKDTLTDTTSRHHDIDN